jgi:hypothetical protein
LTGGKLAGFRGVKLLELIRGSWFNYFPRIILGRGISEYYQSIKPPKIIKLPKMQVTA